MGWERLAVCICTCSLSPGKLASRSKLSCCFTSRWCLELRLLAFWTAIGAMSPSYKKVSCWTNLLPVKSKSELTPRSSRECQSHTGTETASRRVWLKFGYNYVCVVIVLSVWVFAHQKVLHPLREKKKIQEKHRQAIFLFVFFIYTYMFSIYIYISFFFFNWWHLNRLMRSYVSKSPLRVVHFSNQQLLKLHLFKQTDHIL